MNVISKLSQLRQTLRSYRNLHVMSPARNSSAYEGPGKTTVTFISKEIGVRLQVSHCNEIGFTLSNGMSILGPTILFPREVLCWNIPSGKYVNEATLSLITVLEPKPDILIIGLDSTYDFSHIRDIEKLVRSHKIPVEVIPVAKACTVFNFVNEEGRYVVAALIPPKTSRRVLLSPRRNPRRDTREATNDSNSSKNTNDSVRTDTKIE